MTAPATSHLDPLLAGLRLRGVRRVFLKCLSRNHNEKNQIYLAPNLDGLARALHAPHLQGSPSESTRKPESRSGRPKIVAPLDWVWIGNGPDAPAPDTKLIHYFQYPEVRLSGFLKHCRHPPDCLRQRRLDNYGERLLLFGSDGQTTFGAVLATPAGGQCPVPETAHPSQFSGPLFELWLDPSRDTETAIREIRDAWHPGVRLPTAGKPPIPFAGTQAPGYTLEALLGVPTNAEPGPDHAGSELKAFRFGGRITLMTPVPDGGLEHDLGARKFIERYGHRGADRRSLRFTGPYQVGRSRNGRTLRLRGMDGHVLETQSVDLVEESSGLVLASWSIQHLSSSWLKKHDSAFYVEYEKDGEQNLVRFLGYFRCRHTSPERLLDAINRGLVVYDPAHAIKDGRLKIRPQWRISSSPRTLQETLQTLYRSVDWFAPQ